MAKPPEAGPSSDIEGANKSAGEHRTPDPDKGTAEDIAHSDDEAKGRPDHSSKRK